MANSQPITLSLHYRKLERVAHGQPMDAFPALGIATRQNSVCPAAIKMEVLVGCFHVSTSKPEEVEQEVVDRMGRRRRRLT